MKSIYVEKVIGNFFEGWIDVADLTNDEIACLNLTEDNDGTANVDGEFDISWDEGQPIVKLDSVTAFNGRSYINIELANCNIREIELAIEDCGHDMFIEDRQINGREYSPNLEE